MRSLSQIPRLVPAVLQDLRGCHEGEVRLVLVGDAEVEVDVGQLETESSERAPVQTDPATGQSHRQLLVHTLGHRLPLLHVSLGQAVLGPDLVQEDVQALDVMWSW